MSTDLTDRGVQDRFWNQVTIAWDACWIWNLAHNTENYAVFNIARGHQMVAHRVAYIALRGPIPAGMVLDHRCRNRWCVNPFHLDVVTQRENILRGTSPASWHVHKRFCIHGHRYDAGNTYLRPGGGRACRTCKRISERRRRARRQVTRMPTETMTTTAAGGASSGQGA